MQFDFSNPTVIIVLVVAVVAILVCIGLVVEQGRKKKARS